jgi:hypothetical protein
MPQIVRVKVLLLEKKYEHARQEEEDRHRDWSMTYSSAALQAVIRIFIFIRSPAGGGDDFATEGQTPSRIGLNNVRCQTRFRGSGGGQEGESRWQVSVRVVV